MHTLIYVSNSLARKVPISRLDDPV